MSGCLIQEYILSQKKEKNEKKRRRQKRNRLQRVCAAHGSNAQKKDAEQSLAVASSEGKQVPKRKHQVHGGKEKKEVTPSEAKGEKGKEKIHKRSR